MKLNYFGEADDDLNFSFHRSNVVKSRQKWIKKIPFPVPPLQYGANISEINHLIDQIAPDWVLPKQIRVSGCDEKMFLYC